VIAEISGFQPCNAIQNRKQSFPISPAIEPLIDDVFALGRYVVENLE